MISLGIQGEPQAALSISINSSNRRGRNPALAYCGCGRSHLGLLLVGIDLGILVAVEALRERQPVRSARDERQAHHGCGGAAALACAVLGEQRLSYPTLLAAPADPAVTPV